jgi:type IV pilus assembly protein PilE
MRIMRVIRAIRAARRRPRTPPARGFTLVELLVVLAIISLVAAISLPSIVRIFTAGAEQQAYNVISSQLASARAYAVQNRTYAGVHYQLADPIDPSRRNRCYSLVVRPATAADDLDLNNDGIDDIVVGEYIGAEGFVPRALPYPMAVGEINSHFITGPPFTFNVMPAGAFADFTACTILFDAAGRCVMDPQTQIVFADQENLFDMAMAMAMGGNLYLWDPSVANDIDDAEGDGALGQAGAQTLLLFDIERYNTCNTAFNQADYLTCYGRVLAINVYTGQLMGRD